MSFFVTRQRQLRTPAAVISEKDGKTQEVWKQNPQIDPNIELLVIDHL